MLKIPSSLRRVLEQTPQLQRAYLVGGCVRDHLLGLQPKDYDVEVFGVDYEGLLAALAPLGRVDVVGRSFGVAKLTVDDGRTCDFTLPRRDSKVAQGHRGFEVAFDPGVTPQQAAERRDFTINALMYDQRADQVLDFFGGQADLAARVLRHIGPAFVEDPLRVLRGMQFAGRFRLQAAPETIELCRQIKSTFSELATERVTEEWFKWASQSVEPSLGLRFLQQTEWLDHFAELKALAGVAQDPVWHPEGDVFVHTGHCCDALARLSAWQQSERTTRIALMLATLCHDLGKPQTTQVELKDGRQCIVSPSHDSVGGELAEKFLSRIGVPAAIVARVVPLVVSHMAHLQTHSDRSIRRLAKRLEPSTIEELCLVITADQQGRPPLPADASPQLEELRSRAAALALERAAPQPILLGRHLVELGMKPGREIGAILARAFDVQLDGKFDDLAGAIGWLADDSTLTLPDDVRAAAALKRDPR